ncbi:MAG: hypothetical protein ACJAWH_000894 [Maribacter sp.]|jgi:hypothetical protein
MEITAVEKALLPLREQLRSHKLYKNLDTLEDVTRFMESHVYAVWDFMSLLKALQIGLTCTQLPWKPVKNANTARFINEIVLEEETDRTELGVNRSHFEMYLDAMEEVGADSNNILHFLDKVQGMDCIQDTINNSELSFAAKEFLRFTFEVIESNELHKIAAAFTFGREELIPDMFLKIIDNTSKEGPNAYPKLSYYLKRHIELDGNDHGPLSIKMIVELCDGDAIKWNEVLEISKKSLQCRINLWNEISGRIVDQKRFSEPIL